MEPPPTSPNTSDWVKTISGILVPISIFAAGALISFCGKTADDKKLTQDKQIAERKAEEQKKSDDERADAKLIADDEQADTKLIADLLRNFASTNQQERVITVKFVSILILNGDVSRKYASIIEIASQDPNPAVREAGNNAADSIKKEIQENPISSTTKQLATVAQTSGISFLSKASFLPRVFLQIKDEDQRNNAKKIEGVLEENHFLVPGIEKVKSAPPSCEIRYFLGDDKEMAKKIAGILKDQGVECKDVPLSGYGPNVKPQTFEIWFGENSFTK